MSEHTPGPWKVIPPGHGAESEYLCVQIGADESYATLEMRPADARLIAVAPEMRELLLEVAADLEDRLAADDEPAHWLRDRLDRINAVMARIDAEGDGPDE